MTAIYRKPSGKATPSLSIPPWEVSPLLATRESTPVTDLAGRVFTGGMTIADMRYIAMAVLQLADENKELRRRLEEVEKGRA